MQSFQRFRKENLLEEELLIEAWSQEDMARSLHSLKKSNNGLFKSEKQGNAILNQASSLHSKTPSNPRHSDHEDDFDASEHHKGQLKSFGIPVDLNKHTHYMHVVQHMDMGGYSALGHRAGRGARTSHTVFMLDKHGVTSVHKLHQKDGQVDLKKTEHVWARPKGVEVHAAETATHYDTEPVMVSQHQGEVGKKHSFKATVASVRNLGPSQFGSTYSRGPDQHMSVYKTSEGHVLHHFGTPPKEVTDAHKSDYRDDYETHEKNKATEFNVTATIKKHHVDRMGNHVTLITRPKVSA